MNIIQRVAGLFAKAPANLSPVDSGRWTTLFDSDTFMGSWQQDVQIDRQAILANWAVFACITLIAADIGKLRLKLVEYINGIWIETVSPAFSPVIRKPNRFQTRQQFIENWVTSKLTRGNTYVLKERDGRGIVIAHYVLDASRVTPLVAENGEVYYRLGQDNLSGVNELEGVYVPASEIIHDRMNCLFHPLVGLSPIYANGLSATQGLKIQKNSAKFFENMSRPSGVLTAPGSISTETAGRLKDHWESSYGGDKFGKVAVLGDGLSYQPMTITAVEAQLSEQLKASAEMICSTFHVPAFKIGAGTIPAGQKVGDLNQIYYSDCLQSLMEAVEGLLDESLGLDSAKDGRLLGTMFDLDDLLKMDGATLTSVLTEQTGAGITKLDEARARINLPPMTGGDSAYLQQQNFSVDALARRDAGADPFGMAPAAPEPMKSIEALIQKSHEATEQRFVDMGKAFERTLAAEQKAVSETAAFLHELQARLIAEVESG